MSVIKLHTLNCDERLLDRSQALIALAEVTGRERPFFCTTWIGEEESLPELRRRAIRAGWAREEGIDLCAAHKSSPEASCSHCGSRLIAAEPGWLRCADNSSHSGAEMKIAVTQEDQ